ncbi:MAG: hypothetical protein MUO82_10665 [Candidatus Thermoplasmatota archaeon]|nr:hypothetical protein [Candidatus Thermoplasmatota archaeon]
MNKKIIMFGSFLTIFLMVMIPVVNAIEYNQVENNLEKKINPIREQIRVKHIISSYKLEDIQKLRDIISKINNNPASSCSTCRINLSMRPLCKILLKLCLYFLSLFAILSPSIMEADYFLIIALTIFLTALGMGCAWALIIFFSRVLIQMPLQ